jgi:hypothetical protein
MKGLCSFVWSAAREKGLREVVPKRRSLPTVPMSRHSSYLCNLCNLRTGSEWRKLQRLGFSELAFRVGSNIA